MNDPYITTLTAINEISIFFTSTNKRDAANKVYYFPRRSLRENGR